MQYQRPTRGAIVDQIATIVHHLRQHLEAVMRVMEEGDIQFPQGTSGWEVFEDFGAVVLFGILK